LFVYCMHWK